MTLDLAKAASKLLNEAMRLGYRPSRRKITETDPLVLTRKGRKHWGAVRITQHGAMFWTQRYAPDGVPTQRDAQIEEGGVTEILELAIQQARSDHRSTSTRIPRHRSARSARSRSTRRRTA